LLREFTILKLKEKMAAGEDMEVDSPAVDIVDVEKDAKRSAEQRKEEGNQLYKNKKYAEALQKYSQAIELCPDNPAFLWKSCCMPYDVVPIQ